MISLINSKYLLIYLCVVGVAGAFIIWWTRKNIIKVENQKSKQIKKLNSFEAIKTISPVYMSSQAANDNPFFANYETPRFWVMEMGEKGCKCWLAAWVDSPENAWEFGNDVRTRLIDQLKINEIKTHGIEINLSNNELAK